MNDLNKLAAEIHAEAVEKGFWDVPDAEEKAFACMHAELSEAIQEDRKGMPMLYVDDIEFYIPETQRLMALPAEKIPDLDGRKPEGVAVELADFVMRLLDWAAENECELFRLPSDEKTMKETELPKLVNLLHLTLGVIYDERIDAQFDVVDCVTAVYDWLNIKGFDLFQLIRMKMEYNKLRPRLHGRRY